MQPRIQPLKNAPPTTFDFCEDVAPLSREAVPAIVDCFEKNGAVTMVSSIHVNGWFGDHDKLSNHSKGVMCVYPH